MLPVWGEARPMEHPVTWLLTLRRQREGDPSFRGWVAVSALTLYLPCLLLILGEAPPTVGVAIVLALLFLLLPLLLWQRDSALVSSAVHGRWLEELASTQLSMPSLVDGVALYTTRTCLTLAAPVAALALPLALFVPEGARLLWAAAVLLWLGASVLVALTGSYLVLLVRAGGSATALGAALLPACGSLAFLSLPWWPGSLAILAMGLLATAAAARQLVARLVLEGPRRPRRHRRPHSAPDGADALTWRLRRQGLPHLPATTLLPVLLALAPAWLVPLALTVLASTLVWSMAEAAAISVADERENGTWVTLTGTPLTAQQFMSAWTWALLPGPLLQVLSALVGAYSSAPPGAAASLGLLLAPWFGLYAGFVGAAHGATRRAAVAASLRTLTFGICSILAFWATAGIPLAVSDPRWLTSSGLYLMLVLGVLAAWIFRLLALAGLKRACVSDPEAPLG